MSKNGCERLECEQNQCEQMHVIIFAVIVISVCRWVWAFFNVSAEMSVSIVNVNELNVSR